MRSRWRPACAASWSSAPAPSSSLRFAAPRRYHYIVQIVMCLFPCLRWVICCLCPLAAVLPTRKRHIMQVVTCCLQRTDEHTIAQDDANQPGC